MATTTHPNADKSGEEVLMAALCSIEEGLIVLGSESQVLVWNPTATAITGYPSPQMTGQRLPVNFYQVHEHSEGRMDSGSPRTGSGQPERPVLVHLRHSHGHTLPAMLRRTPLRNELGRRFGTLLRFHPAEEIDALPHGESDGDIGSENRLEGSRAGLENRLDEAARNWRTDAVPYGVIWVLVDQGTLLRKTHGSDAFDVMLGIVERTLLHGLRPAEFLGRWGSHEFLVLCHERSVEMLESHAKHLCTLASTADFRWWGDRVPLTVSIGAAQAEQGESLRNLLFRTQKAMQAVVASGGNQTILSRTGMALAKRLEEQQCSQS